VDPNEYYGGAEAAFSLQEVEDWVAKIKIDTCQPFRNASLWKPDDETSNTSKLSFSRAYTLTLSPQIIYTKSKLLSKLVSSKVYRQLEFQAVGNWWIYDGEGALKRLPTGREDISQDKAINNHTKRSLMKFLKFVIDYENQSELWKPQAESGLSEFLSLHFQLPRELQTVMAALTLSFNALDQISVKWALPRIATHLTSIGVFGPGFGAVVPKWGGGAEIAQVACRAGAVGGGVYVLGTGISDSSKSTDEDGKSINITQLSNGESVRSTYLVQSPASPQDSIAVSKMIAIISSPLQSLFHNSVEGSPLAAVTVITIPPNTITINDLNQSHPVYIMLHSSETGECPAGQSVLYATTLYKSGSNEILNAAVRASLKAIDNGQAELLYILYYEQCATASSPLDLAFNDAMLEEVEKQWKTIIADVDVLEPESFMAFQDRPGINNEDDEVDDEF